MRVTDWEALAPGYDRAWHGEDEIIGVEGPCFGIGSIRLTWLTGTVDHRPGAARAVWDRLERGTGEYERAEWFGALEGIGARFDARIGRSWASIEIDAFEDALEEALHIGLEPLFSPNEDPEDLADWCAEVREDLAADLEDAVGTVQRLVPARLWAGQDWSAATFGSATQREMETAETLAEVRGALLGAPLVLCIAADAPRGHLAHARRVLDRVRAAFPARGRVQRATPELVPGGAFVAHRSEQAAVRWAVAAPAAAGPDWAAAVVFGTGFGGGFTSPWIARIRGELGLAYDVGWSSVATPGGGLWLGRALPASDEVSRVLDEWSSLWATYCATPPDDDALEMARALSVGHHLAALDTASARAAHAGLVRALGLPLERAWTFADSLQRVSRDDCAKVASQAPAASAATWVAALAPEAGPPRDAEEWWVDPASGLASRLAKSVVCR